MINKNNSFLLTVISLTIAIVAFFIYFSTLANLDLISGRFGLHVDERITFDGIQKIIHPNDYQSFLWAVINGGDQRYGRILWNSMAVFSYIPELAYGESGQIVAGRMFQVLLLVVAYLVLAFGLLLNWFCRLLLAIVFFSIPYVTYFSAIPKPEPIQILFLTIFCYYFYKNGLGFGWFYIFLGLAFGAKISTLFVAIPFTIFSLYFNYKNKGGNLKYVVTGIFYFLIGFGISVPILMGPLIILIIGCYIYHFISSKLNIRPLFNWVFIAFFPLIIGFNFKSFIMLWVNATFLNTAHGADQSSVNIFSWLEYFFSNWLIGPKYINFILIFSSISFFLLFILNSYRNYNFNNKNIVAVSIFISGFSLNLGIFLIAHRLWGLYLYPGTLLILFSLILMLDSTKFLDKIFSAKNKAGDLFKISTFTIISGRTVAITIIFLSAGYWVPNAFSCFSDLRNRTHQREYLLNKESYDESIRVLTQVGSIKGHQLVVMYSPALFWPSSNSNFRTEEFWGPYNRWMEGFDAVVLHKDNTPLGEPFPVDSPLYKNYLIEQQGYRDHVVFSKSIPCKINPCFYRESQLPNFGEVLVKTSN